MLEADLDRYRTCDLTPIVTLSVQPAILPLASRVMDERGYELMNITPTIADPAHYAFAPGGAFVVMRSIWKRKSAALAATETPAP